MDLGAKDKIRPVLSNTELVGLGAVFVFILYIIFPKDRLKSLALEKDANLMLSLSYLKNIYLSYPNDKHIELALARKYLEVGNFKESSKLIEKLLINNQDIEVLKEAYKLKYTLAKFRYFKDENPKVLEEAKRLLNVYYTLLKNKSDFEFLYNEAKAVGVDRLRYIAIKELLAQAPENMELLEEAFLMAFMLKKEKEIYAYVQKITASEAQLTTQAREALLNFFWKQKDFKRAFIEAKRLLVEAKDLENMLRYFNTSFQMAVAGNLNIQAYELIAQYKRYIYSEIEFARVVLNYYIGSQKLNLANNFVTQLFREKREFFSDEAFAKSALNSFLFNSKLKEALNMALFGMRQFDDAFWIEKSAQIYGWLGDAQKSTALYTILYKVRGLQKYKDDLIEASKFSEDFDITIPLYKEEIARGDYTHLQELASIYDYTGEIGKAKEYFYGLVRDKPSQEIYQYAIGFLFKDSEYSQGLALYRDYVKRYGVDIKLGFESAKILFALKEFNKAYTILQEVGSKVHTAQHKEILYFLVDLAWIRKDYKESFRVLKKIKKLDLMRPYDLERLINISMQIDDKETVKKNLELGWRTSKKWFYLTDLLNRYLQDDEYERFEKLLAGIDEQTQETLNKNEQFLIILSNYYAKVKNFKKAMQTFKQAFKLNKRSVSTHQAYLWFLMDNKLIKATIKEIDFLRKNPSLQKAVGFASVAGAFWIGRSDLTLKWLIPMLKVNPDNLEYLVLYADLLELQDREEGAKKVRLRAFERIKRMLKENPTLKKDKSFVRTYLRMMTYFGAPSEKINAIFKKYQHLFSKADFMDMKVSYLAMIQADDAVRYYVSKNSKALNVPWLNLYLSLAENSHAKRAKALKGKEAILPIRDRVSASYDIGNHKKAQSLAFKGLEENRNDWQLYKLFYDTLPKPSLAFKYTNAQLDKRLYSQKQELSYNTSLYKNIFLDFSFINDTIKADMRKGKNFVYPLSPTQNSLKVGLESRYKRTNIKVDVGINRGLKEFLSTSAQIEYKHDIYSHTLKAEHNAKAHESSYLYMGGMEDKLSLDVFANITQRQAVGLNLKGSIYKSQDNYKVGEGKHIQLNYSYRLRGGYPDITFIGYLGTHFYTLDKALGELRFLLPRANTPILPKNFSEVGGVVNIGEQSQLTYHRSWRPFGSFGLTYNTSNPSGVGTNFTFGVGGMLFGKDALNLKLDYSNGVGAITSESYRAYVEYRLWDLSF